MRCPQQIIQARVLPGGAAVAVVQTGREITVSVPEALRDHPVTVIALTLDQAVTGGQEVVPLR